MAYNLGIVNINSSRAKKYFDDNPDILDTKSDGFEQYEKQNYDKSPTQRERDKKAFIKFDTKKKKYANMNKSYEIPTKRRMNLDNSFGQFATKEGKAVFKNKSFLELSNSYMPQEQPKPKANFVSDANNILRTKYENSNDLRIIRLPYLRLILGVLNCGMAVLQTGVGYKHSKLWFLIIFGVLFGLVSFLLFAFSASRSLVLSLKNDTFIYKKKCLFYKKLEEHPLSTIVNVTTGKVRISGVYTNYISNCVNIIYEVDKVYSEHASNVAKARKKKEYITFSFSDPNYNACLNNARVIIKYLQLPIILDEPYTNDKKGNKNNGRSYNLSVLSRQNNAV